jgi:hypothetical protein
VGILLSAGKRAAQKFPSKRTQLATFQAKQMSDRDNLDSGTWSGVDIR